MASSREYALLAARRVAMTERRQIRDLVSTQQIARGAEYEYTFDCHLGQGGVNFGAVAKLHSDLAAEFSGQTRPTFAEYGFRRRVAVLRCLRSLTAEEVGRLRAIFDDFNMRVAEHEAVGAALDNRCTGMTAIWCPRCGDCKCPLNEAGERSLDGSACPLHAPDSAHGEPAGLVRARHPLGDRDRAPPTLLRQLLTDARSNLEGWAEPNGYLVPSEPDLEERARIRISLRGLITGYMIALGEEPPRSQFEKDDLRDRLRIAEAAVADQEAAARG